MAKICKLCEREIGDGDFYKGVPNAHKACHAKRAREYRLANLERCKEYDRSRANDPDRIAARQAYAKSDRGREVGNASKRRFGDEIAVLSLAHFYQRRFAKKAVYFA